MNYGLEQVRKVPGRYNGRMGRLLISLLFAREKVLHEPLLYLSLYFKSNRDQYYDLLQRVRTQGDWESWFEFFYHGLVDVAEGAAKTARRLLHLFEEDKTNIQKQAGRTAAPAVHELLMKKMVVAVPKAAEELKLSRPTVYSALMKLTDLGIAREFTGKERYKQFVYEKYRAILNEGAEPG